MRRWLTVALFAAILFASSRVRAQGPARFASVRVDVWPEYDRPAVLVITHILLASDTSLPAHLDLRVPARATLWAVAEVTPTGGRINASVERREQGEWTGLSITTNELQVQVEYYDLLAKDGPARHIVYDWPGDAAVDAFTVNFLQPAGAADLVLVPPAVTSSVNEGLTYYQTGAVKLGAGQKFTLTADYRKQTDNLSVSGMPVEPVQTISGNSLSRLWSSTSGKIVLAVVLGLLVTGGLIGVVLRQKNRGPAAPRKRHVQAGVTSESPAAAVYCSQCGKRAQTEDVFCRSCGVRLRKPE